MLGPVTVREDAVATCALSVVPIPTPKLSSPTVATPVTLSSTNSTLSMFTTPSNVVMPPTVRFSLMCRLSVIVVNPSVDTPAFDMKLELIATFSISV